MKTRPAELAGGSITVLEYGRAIPPASISKDGGRLGYGGGARPAGFRGRHLPGGRFEGGAEFPLRLIPAFFVPVAILVQAFWIKNLLAVGALSTPNDLLPLVTSPHGSFPAHGGSAAPFRWCAS